MEDEKGKKEREETRTSEGVEHENAHMEEAILVEEERIMGNNKGDSNEGEGVTMREEDTWEEVEVIMEETRREEEDIEVKGNGRVKDIQEEEEGEGKRLDKERGNKRKQ